MSERQRHPAENFENLALMDALGRYWPAATLDRLLADPGAFGRVRALYVNAHIGGRRGADFASGLVWRRLKDAGHRDEVAALYLLLVARYRDTRATPPASEDQGAQP